jgi:hypothetical protein
MVLSPIQEPAQWDEMRTKVRLEAARVALEITMPNVCTF